MYIGMGSVFHCSGQACKSLICVTTAPSRTPIPIFLRRMSIPLPPKEHSTIWWVLCSHLNLQEPFLLKEEMQYDSNYQWLYSKSFWGLFKSGCQITGPLRSPASTIVLSRNQRHPNRYNKSEPCLDRPSPAIDS